MDALQRYGAKKFALAGGVASNSMLRRLMPDAVFGEARYSTDNAMGVAVLTWLKHSNQSTQGRLSVVH